eukprot:6196002-Pleurochrysis_carterae.AAC.1
MLIRSRCDSSARSRSGCGRAAEAPAQSHAPQHLALRRLPNPGEGAQRAAAARAAFGMQTRHR